MSAVVQQLIRLRKDLRMTQAQVAAAVGVGQPSISEFERGSTDPRLSTVQKYVEALGYQIVLSLEKVEK